MFVCMWRDGRCVERGGFVGVFVCGETGSEWRKRQGCLCVYVERMGCGCGENGVWLWRAEVCGASDGCVLGSRGGEMGR